jgi:predicted kinase
MSKKRLYLFVGYPGTGKTTAAKLIHEASGAQHLWADKIRKELFGTPNLTVEQTNVLYAQLNQMTADLLHDGQSVIFDTNFNFYKDRELLRELATKEDAELVLLYMTTPKDLARKRAVEATEDHGTRVWGKMESADFERISSNLEPPLPSEHAVELNGTTLDLETIKQQLDL